MPLSNAQRQFIYDNRRENHRVPARYIIMLQQVATRYYYKHLEELTDTLFQVIWTTHKDEAYQFGSQSTVHDFVRNNMSTRPVEILKYTK